jgi:transcriptional regulator with XRE-family HTH domain
MKKPTDTKTPGRRLAYIRWEKRMTLAEFAATLGADPSTLHGWEHSRTRPSWRFADKIYRLYKIPVAAWYAEKGEAA